MPKGKTLRGHTPAAERKIIYLYVVTRLGTRAIARYMTEHRYRTQRGGPWRKSTVLAILQRNGVYAGHRVPDEQTKFFALTREDPNGCILWTGGVSDKGYGRFTFGGRTRYAHIVAYGFAHYDAPPSGTQLHHVCGHPLCVNHVHLHPTRNRSEHARLHQLERAHLEYIASEEYVAEILGHVGDKVLAAAVVA